MKWIKYYLIVMYSYLSCQTCVNMFGSTWLVSGNIVKRVK